VWTGGNRKIGKEDIPDKQTLSPGQTVAAYLILTLAFTVAPIVFFMEIVYKYSYDRFALPLHQSK